ncbi:P-loop containing nucleoside triphosphate hydrolases superfamily protein [Wolffia australiana]
MEGRTNWRKEADESLRRLHSLLFATDDALERNDYASAQILGVSLLGFLDSRSETEIDATFVSPIRAGVCAKIDVASRALAEESDRLAFEQAGIEEGRIFTASRDSSIDKVIQSQYFSHLRQKPDGFFPDNGRPDPKKEDKKHGEKVSKVSKQLTLTSLYVENGAKPVNVTYDKIMRPESNNLHYRNLVEKTNVLPSKNSDPPEVVQVGEEERLPSMVMKSKRRQVEFNSPVCGQGRSPSNTDDAHVEGPANGFVTARKKLEMDSRQRHGLIGSPSASVSSQADGNPSGSTRNYGLKYNTASRRGIRGNFVPPVKSNGGNVATISSRITGKSDDSLEDSTKRCLEMLCGPDGELPEKLRNLEPRLIEHVSNEIMDKDPDVHWEDIAGLEHAKKCVTEMVIWPLLRPDIFRGCRSPGKGLLLFGPPGTGKTMIGKAIAGEAKATFFYISASSLTSKWIGEGEKLVRALFGVASCRQPAVIFVDEIDSLLSQRKSEGEHESSRRLKTQFLIEMEGFDNGNDQVLLIGATNRPQELDEAARRRLTKRLYIPLPSSEARAWIIRNLLEKDGLFKLSQEEIVSICKLTEGYSGSDMKNLVKDASMGPLREALARGIDITKLQREDMRPVTLVDFEKSLQEVRPSVSANELGTYEQWNSQFGSLAL